MSFKIFVYSKLGLLLPPEPVLSAEAKEARKMMSEGSPEWLLDERFEIKRLANELVNPLETIDSWVREYFGSLGCGKIEKGPMDVYYMEHYIKDVPDPVEYSVNISYFSASRHFIASIEAVPSTIPVA